MSRLKLIFFITIILITLIFPIALSAQNTDESDQIRDAVKEKVKERIQNVTTRKVGLVGILEKITEKTLLIANQQNKLTITTDENTEYLRFPGKRNLDRDELELNQYAIILGIQESDKEEVAAKIVQLIDEPEIPQRTTIYGIIANITNNSLTITTEKNQTWEINLSRSTEYTQKTTTNKLETIKFSSLEENDLVVIGGNPVEEEPHTLKGLIVHRLPQPEPTPESNSDTPEAGTSAEPE